jgi:hypothetical protein
LAELLRHIEWKAVSIPVTKYVFDYEHTFKEQANDEMEPAIHSDGHDLQVDLVDF